mmetsp:Transcript_19661/g.30359  ORF Transcript_19661/g.30359 Transcript_19661/m.30359 type:complete len:87 (+) Transcript_19661:3191-3451(+)
MKKPSFSLRYNPIRKQATMGATTSGYATTKAAGSSLRGNSTRGMSGRIRGGAQSNHKELGRVVMDSQGLLLIPSEKFGQTMRIPVR